MAYSSSATAAYVREQLIDSADDDLTGRHRFHVPVNWLELRGSTGECNMVVPVLGGD